MKPLKSKTKRVDLPLSTPATRAAERGRQKANAMTEDEAEEYFRLGMLKIYGSQPKETDRLGHKRHA